MLRGCNDGYNSSYNNSNNLQQLHNFVLRTIVKGRRGPWMIAPRLVQIFGLVLRVSMLIRDAK
jgi:hypothetical protein